MGVYTCTATPRNIMGSIRRRQGKLSVTVFPLIFTENKSKKPITMPETRVPMTLRDHFLQDPFFNSSWSDMGKAREHFSQQSQIMSKRFEDSWSKSDKGTNSSLVP